ncbi:MAG TPA: membrane protein insertase YidC [Acidobacteriota bacterium]|nr:membrane protein insertase YidC [Acidobacteriota bacterium]
MDKRTLIAIFLILGVLLVDSIWWSQRSRQRQPVPTTPTADSGGVAGVAGSAAPGAAGSAAGTGAATATPPAGGSTAAAPSSSVVGAPTLGGESRVAMRIAASPVEEHRLETKAFHATLSTQGGAVTSWTLPGYKNPLTKGPVDLVRLGGSAMHVVVSAGNTTFDFTNAPFQVVEYERMRGLVAFEALDSSGVRVRKTYRLDRDPSLLDLEIRVSAPASLGPIRYRFGWASPLPLTEQFAKTHELKGTALLGEKLLAYDEKGLGKEGAKLETGNVRWAGDRSKYFVAALIPDSLSADQVAFLPAADATSSAWLTGAATPGSEVVRHARLYAGAIHFDTLVGVGSGMERLVNFGWSWLEPISKFLLKCLLLLYQWIPNYGVGIILLSLATKVVFYPLTQSSLRTMKIMHRLQPRMNELRTKYKDDPAKMNTAVMALYKEHKVNPLGGCLPMLLQIPFFFALYNVFLNAVELRAAHFMGHITDLSAPDVLMMLGPLPLSLMPILMTLSTFWMQALTPTDPAQKPIMMVMPVMMLFFMYTLPSGVILYWTVNNVLSALQQQWVNYVDDRHMAATSS